MRVDAQGGTWVWVKGGSALNTPANYGTQGVRAPTNNPQGLYEAASWTDLQGNFWIFGGNYAGLSDANINCDLWRYEPATNMWTWMKGPGQPSQFGVYGTKGVPSAANYPGARSWGCTAWTDNNGDLWLYGGSGYGNTIQVAYADDLWRYHIATNEWTWMGGDSDALNNNDVTVYGVQGVAAPANTPGGRWEDNSSWTDDNGRLWLYGGGGWGDDNDLWRYDIGTGLWTWVKGPQIGVDPTGNFGTLGVESPTNLPPAGWTYTNWKDAEGNFYIWGGQSSNGGNLGSVWEYKPSTNNWIWIAGIQPDDDPGNYEQYCIQNNYTRPRSRVESRGARTRLCTNLFYAFGGADWVSFNAMNDLWAFNTQTREWTWLSGSPNFSNAGSYGTLGVPAATNLPPSRLGMTLWIDTAGTLWLFGGMNDWNDAQCYNDVWKFMPDEKCIGPAVTGINYTISKTTICARDTALLTLINLTGAQITPATGIEWLDTAHILLFPDTTTRYMITGGSQCHPVDSALLTINVIKPQAVSADVDTTLCPGQSIRLCAPINLVTFAWSTGATTQCIQATQAGIYGVSVTDVNGCKNSGADTVLFHIAPPVFITSSGTTCPGDSQQLCATAGYRNYVWSTGATDSCIYVYRAAVYAVTITDTFRCNNSTSDSAQFYPLIQMNLDTTGAACYGGANGTITAVGANGFDTAGLSYSWRSATGPIAGTGYTLTGLSAGAYYVTITGSDGCHIADSTLLTQPDSLKIASLLSQNISCFGLNNGAISTMATGGTPPVRYSDNGGASYQPLPVFSPLAPGNYTVQIEDSNNCITGYTQTVSLTEPPAIQVFITSPDNRDLKFGDTIQLFSNYNSAVMYPVTSNWSPDNFINCDTCANITAVGVETTTFTLVVRDSNGCYASDTFTIYVNSDKAFFVPNAFTPNGDGHNDVFYVYANGVARVDCYIFDRWGEKVDEFHNIHDGWNGEYKGHPAPMAVYVYWIELVYLDGSVRHAKGSVTLIR